MSDILQIAWRQLALISVFGNHLYLIIPAFIIGGYYLYKKGHKTTLFIFLLTSVSSFYSFYLKALFRQMRPETALSKVYSFDIYGFPSSHVVFYTTFWGFIFYLTIKYVKEEKLIMHTLRWICAYMIILVGASRIFLGMHYLKDVIAGYFFGGFFLLLLIWLDTKLSKVSGKN
jgi:undecaprenyl-diphosphatase